MEDIKLKIMIEQFFDAILTAEEERELCNYLRKNNVPAELRKDKETILAFCQDCEDVELPDGAETRLIAMLDKLADETKETEKQTTITKTEKRSISGIPRSTLRWIAEVAAIITVGIFIIKAWTPYETSRQNTLAHIYDTEKDTFDNPEDAIRCLKAAFDDINIATNHTQRNIKEIEAILSTSIKTGSKRDNNI